MIRILFVAVMVASGSLAQAHEGKTCKCHQQAGSMSFREEALGDFFPMTREVMTTMLHADEWGMKVETGFRLATPRAVIISVPPMGPAPVNLDFRTPQLGPSRDLDGQPSSNHLAVS